MAGKVRHASLGQRFDDRGVGRAGAGEGAGPVREVLAD